MFLITPVHSVIIKFLQVEKGFRDRKKGMKKSMQKVEKNFTPFCFARELRQHESVQFARHIDFSLVQLQIR